nr:PhnD/SsuA/transferrin family substrate-binding protein [Acinetobacter baumannii]
MDRSLGECRPTTVRFCTTSEQGINKCNDLGKVVLSRRMDTSIGCILESTTADCITAVKEGRADIITLDGGDVYRAGKYSELVPIASELYGEVDATYYAVAVIPADSEISQPEDLRGKRSCHTGIGRTAGWVMPVGFFINSTLIPKNQCDRTAAVADLFSASCAPGANDAKYNPTGSGAVKLCQQCIGDENGEHKCSRSSVERYSGYSGAFRCLIENNGDVAFVKHTTASEYTNGKSDLDWAKELKSSDYKLLCKNGGIDDIENYENCNLGKVPSHQVMISGSATFDRRLELATKIADINKWFGLLSVNFDIFKSYGNKADLLFKDSTTELKVLPLHATYRDALGDDYLNAVEAADPLLCTQEA